MRTLKISLVFWGLFFSLPALAADDQAEDQPPKMKLGGADTRAPGPLTVQPADIQLPSDQKPQPLTDLPQTQDGGFVLKPGFYETDFRVESMVATTRGNVGGGGSL